jgi:hypothetical protein
MTLESDQISPTTRRVKASKNRAQRSRVANGSKLVTGVDGRSAWVRRAKDQIFAHCQWRGGEAACSSCELSGGCPFGPDRER